MNLADFASKYKNGSRIVLDWLGSGGITVDSEQAQNRSDICTGRLSGNPCPHNRQEAFFTSAAGEAIKEIVKIKNEANLRVDGERKLKGCAVCGCYLRLAIHVPAKHFKSYTSKEELAKYPDICWKKKEIEALCQNES